MACSGCSGGPSKYSPEYYRRQKPENHSGCGCGGSNGSCDTPSRAIAGSPLAEWEATHGKLVTTVAIQQDAYGRTVTVVTKEICSPSTSSNRNRSCCSFRYKVNR